MSFIKILSRLTDLKYFPLVLSLILIIPFTLLPIISSSHFPIISGAWSATYYVDATNGNNSNNGLSMSSAWKTIAKVKASNFNPGGEILFKGGRLGEGNLSFLLQDKKANPLSVSLFHLSRPDTLFALSRFDPKPSTLCFIQAYNGEINHEFKYGTDQNNDI